MTNLIGDYAYSGENALDLYHLFVNELDSKIVDGYLNIGSFHLRIRDHDNEKRRDYDYQMLGKFVSYFCQGCETKRDQFHQFIIKISKWEPKEAKLEIYHFVPSQHDRFDFPLNNIIVKEQPIWCFNKWIEIAVNGMPTLDQVAEFDSFINIQKEHRNFKKKINFLRLSLNKSRQHSLLNSIVSNEHLKHEILKNGSRH